MKKTKVVVVGNCQARPLAMAFERLSQDVEVTAVAIVHLLKSGQFEEYRHYFEQADYIVSQLVAENYPCEFVRTDFLKEKYGRKVVSIVNLYFTGYTPDWFYVRIPGKGPLRGPMGDYQNKTILKSWMDGESPKIASHRMRDKSFNCIYATSAKDSIDLLRGKEQQADVPIVNFIEAKYKSERLFFTFNHPAFSLIAEYARAILIYLGVEFGNIVAPNVEPLGKFSPKTNPVCGLLKKDSYHAGVDFGFSDRGIVLREARKFDDLDLVKAFYTIFPKYHEALMSENVKARITA